MASPTPLTLTRPTEGRSPPPKEDHILKAIRYFHEAGIGFVEGSALQAATPPLAYPRFHGFNALEHARLGLLAALSETDVFRMRAKELVKWILAAPTPARILRVCAGGILFELGDVIVQAKPPKWDDDLDKIRYDVDVYGPADALYQVRDWVHTAVVLKAKRAEPKVHFLRIHSDGSIGLLDAPIKKTTLQKDAHLFYGSDIEEFHTRVLTRLRKDRHGLVLLHGPPGGGKTTYVRHLTSCLMGKKKVIMIPKSSLDLMGTPRFTEFLIGLHAEPSILVIEDAEEVVAASSRASGPSTSTLLNITDGIVNDVAGVQVILTFNCHIGAVDQAILRSGRLIGRREFGPLSAMDARALAASRSLDTSQITGPTMLCDILAQNPAGHVRTSTRMGFRPNGEE